MANVGPSAGSGRQGPHEARGQLILIGGVVVAFALVALVLLLNTALFTENVATRGLGADHDRADDHRAFVQSSADRVLRAEERIEYQAWNAADENTTHNFERIDAAVRQRQLQQHGARGGLQVSSLRRGAVLTQENRSRSFTAGGSNASQENWTLADTTGIRHFTMTVDAANTSEKTEPGTFTVVINGGQWSAEVYESGDNVEISVRNQTCTSNATVATINWTAGTLGNCSFSFGTDASGDPLTAPYRVAFQNGSNATGTYHVVVSNQSGSEVVEGNFGAAGSDDNPRLYHAVYAARLKVHYEGPTTSYETHIRVAPGEPQETSPTS